jgi:mono/diheme cytochrome c family protein
MHYKFLLGGIFMGALSFNALAEYRADAPAHDAMNVLRSSDVSFKKDIQPIFNDYCVSCHRPTQDSKGYVKSGLDLTSYEGLMKGTKFGKVVIPGDSEASTLSKLLTGTNKGLKMPMGLNAAGTLDRQYILAIRKWVKQGAKNN